MTAITFFIFILLFCRESFSYTRFIRFYLKNLKKTKKFFYFPYLSAVWVGDKIIIFRILYT